MSPKTRRSIYLDDTIYRRAEQIRMEAWPAVVKAKLAD
jgi:hypothetical protein